MVTAIHAVGLPQERRSLTTDLVTPIASGSYHPSVFEGLAKPAYFCRRLQAFGPAKGNVRQFVAAARLEPAGLREGSLFAAAIAMQGGAPRCLLLSPGESQVSAPQMTLPLPYLWAAESSVGSAASVSWAAVLGTRG